MFNYEDSIMSLLEEFIKVSEQILTELVEERKIKCDESCRVLNLENWTKYKKKLIRYKYCVSILDQPGVDDQCRRPNFPENISENIVRFLLYKTRNQIYTREGTGDLNLIGGQHRVEVKTFATAKTPCSFGPKTPWDEIYFLDATRFRDEIFKCYRVNLPHNSDVWKQLRISKTKSMEDGRTEGKRPRHPFDGPQGIKSQLPQEYVTEIYNGTFDDIFRIE